MTEEAHPVWERAAVQAFLGREFPQEFGEGHYVIERLAADAIEMVLKTAGRHLRPGGTVSGPTIMALMDCAAYALIIGRHGAHGKSAVTTSMSLSFLRKGGPGDLRCEVSYLKEGRTLTVVDARVWDDVRQKLLAHGEFTYHLDLNRPAVT